MRLSKYTKTPIGFFLELPVGEFVEGVKTMNEEIRMENKMMENAAKRK